MYNGYEITASFEPDWEGSGTEEDPYQIVIWCHLHNVHSHLNSYFVLVNNLDSTTDGYEELTSPTANQGKGWIPIGSLDWWRFIGSLDGQGYEIRDLSYKTVSNFRVFNFVREVHIMITRE